MDVDGLTFTLYLWSVNVAPGMEFAVDRGESMGFIVG